MPHEKFSDLFISSSPGCRIAERSEEKKGGFFISFHFYLCQELIEQNYATLIITEALFKEGPLKGKDLSLEGLSMLLAFEEGG